MKPAARSLFSLALGVGLCGALSSPRAPARTTSPDAAIRIQDDEPPSEFQVLAHAKRVMKEGSRKERMEALQAVAQLAFEDPRHPSPKIARELAKYLDEGEVATRVEAARLLALGQDPSTALSELGKRVEGAAKLLRRFMAETERWKNQSRLSYLSRFPQFENLHALNDYPRAIRGMIVALGTMPDDRAVDAVLDVLEMPIESASEELFLAGVDALLKLESQEAVEAVLDAVVDLREDLEPAEPRYDSKGRLVETKRDKDPRFGRLSSLKVFSDRYPPIDAATLGLLVAKVRAWAAERKLEPPAAEASSDDWKSWAKTLRGRFPKKLPGLR